MNELVNKAEALAAQAHGGQFYSEFPYIEHPRAVVEVLLRFGYNDPVLLAAAWLHDAIEDNPDITVEQIEHEIHGGVAMLVEAVTNEPGKNRKERFAKTYPKIAKLHLAVILKLADRIANVEYAIKNNPDKLQMYSKEYTGFRQALYSEGVADEMWAHLDGLLIGQMDMPSPALFYMRLVIF